MLARVFSLRNSTAILERLRNIPSIHKAAQPTLTLEGRAVTIGPFTFQQEEVSKIHVFIFGTLFTVGLCGAGVYRLYQKKWLEGVILIAQSASAGVVTAIAMNLLSVS